MELRLVTTKVNEGAGEGAGSLEPGRGERGAGFAGAICRDSKLVSLASILW